MAFGNSRIVGMYSVSTGTWLVGSICNGGFCCSTKSNFKGRSRGNIAIKTANIA
ncbi:hypothetical protein DBV15_12108, partial [Temnothorax longispinosus]